MSEEVIQATGRRKRAIARVRLSVGQGVIKINDKLYDEYFPRKAHQQFVLAALDATQSLARFDISIKTHGGGQTGQAGAVRHGIARALLALDVTMKEALRKNGYLTRDPREKESKKYGRKRARKRFQFSKR